MSDRNVAASLDDLERLLASLMDRPDPRAVDAWHAAFKAAVATAEKGPQWPQLVARARELGLRLDQEVRNLTAIRGAIRVELQAKERGRRALMGYRPMGYPH